MQPDPLAILAPDSVFHVEGLFPGEQLLVGHLHVSGVVGVNPVPPHLSTGTQQLDGREAEYLLHVVTDEDQFPLRIARPDNVRDVRHERTVFPLAGTQRLLGLLAMRDVLDYRLEFQRVSLLPEQAPDGILLPQNSALGPGDPVVEGNHRLLRVAGR